MKPSRLLTFPRLLVLAFASSLCAAQTYTITDLGTVSGMDYSVARAINSAHQVTGASGKSNSYLADVFV